MSWSLERALRRLSFEYADVLLLGLWNKPVSPRILTRPSNSKHAASCDCSGYQRISVPWRPRSRRVETLMWYTSGITPPIREPKRRSFRNCRAPTGPAWFPSRPPVGDNCLASRRYRDFSPARIAPPKSERAPTAGDCYRYVLSRPEVDVCLSGPANTEQMEAAVEALRLGPMSAEELAWMGRVGRAVTGK